MQLCQRQLTEGLYQQQSRKALGLRERGPKQENCELGGQVRVTMKPMKLGKLVVTRGCGLIG